MNFPHFFFGAGRTLLDRLGGGDAAAAAAVLDGTGAAAADPLVLLSKVSMARHIADGGNEQVNYWGDSWKKCLGKKKKGQVLILVFVSG